MGGETLLRKYNSSLHLFLSTIYSDYEWKPWKFITKGLWDDVKIQRQFLDWVATQRNHNNLNDWYNITTKVIAVVIIDIQEYRNYWILAGDIFLQNTIFLNLKC